MRRRALWMTAAVLSFSAAATAQVGRVAPGQVNRTIQVSGEAVVYVVPEEATVRFGIETFDPALANATGANDALGAKLLKALRAAGLAERDIQADHADVEIVYPPHGIAEGIAGYRMRRAFTVTLRDVARLDEILGLVLKNGANHVEGYELRTSQLRKHRDEVRRRAIRAAREKAEALAGELGCAVGPPVSIGEGYYGWFGTRSAWGAGGGMANQMTQNASFSAGAPGGDEASAAPVGQIGVRAQVAVTFELTVK